ncbi:hypothetical protein HMI54_008529 [Coelomomyces lativittatus]|nr:hypothetical protein HMI55_003063 [Coelomomyces lativittatus]KAJ1502946.1 hypothetical protein HMI54_008529 [Coelomomyces lativittatus]KAJ1505966.1 hypothetical protein HMI56_000849 [Coelomomyces lativittatus]
MVLLKNCILWLVFTTCLSITHSEFFSALSNKSVDSKKKYSFGLRDRLEDDSSCHKTCNEIQCQPCPKPSFQIKAQIVYFKDDPLKLQKLKALKCDTMSKNFLQTYFNESVCFCKCVPERRWEYSMQSLYFDTIMKDLKLKYTTIYNQVADLQKDYLYQTILTQFVKPKILHAIMLTLESSCIAIDSFKKWTRAGGIPKSTFFLLRKMESNTRIAINTLYFDLSDYLSSEHVFDEKNNLLSNDSTRLKPLWLKLYKMNTEINELRHYFGLVNQWLKSFRPTKSKKELNEGEYHC